MNISWLKLDINILDDQKIKLIRKYPDGDSLFVLWIGLICLGMKSEKAGVIQIADGLPYTAEELSTVFELPIKTIELGITVFMKYGMIHTTEGGLLEINDFRKNQSIDRIEYKRAMARERIAKYRNKQKNKLLPEPVTRYGVTCNAQIREEKRREDKIREDKKITEHNPSNTENIITLWNSRAHHLLQADTKNKSVYQAINKTLKTETYDDVIKAINIYFNTINNNIDYYYSVNHKLTSFLYGHCSTFKNQELVDLQFLRDKKKLDAGLGLYAYYVKHNLLYKNGKVNKSRDREKPEWHDMGRDYPTNMESYIRQMTILNGSPLSEKYLKEITG